MSNAESTARAPMTSPHERVESRQPHIVVGIVFFGVCAVAFLALGLFGFFNGGTPLGVLGLGLAGVFAWAAVQSRSRQIVVATTTGLDWQGPKGRSFRWDEVEGLGALQRSVGDESFLQLSVYFFDEPARIFTDRWSQWRALAASIQQQRPAPAEQFDLEEALTDAPRGDPAAELRVAPGTVKRFVEAARVALADLGVEVRMSERMLRGHARERGVFELFNIASATIHRPEAEWPGALKAHFDKLLASQSAVAGIDEQFPTLAAAKDHLRLQLVPSSSSLRSMVRRPLAGTELVQVVVFDLGTVTAFLLQTQLAQWNVAEDEVWRAAAEQTSRLPSPTPRPLPDAGGGAVFIEPFCAARWPDVARRVEVNPTYGCFIALPAQEVVVAMPIEDPLLSPFWLGNGRFVPAVRLMAHDTPGPLGPEIYWAQGGRLTRVLTSLSADGRFVFAPPAALYSLVARD